MSQMAGSKTSPGSSQGTFARRATGLVREVSPFSTFVFNMAAQPTAILIATAAFILPLAFFPGGSIWLGFAMAFVLAILLCLCYGLFTSAIPRSGRTVSPSINAAKRRPPRAQLAKRTMVQAWDAGRNRMSNSHV